MEEWVARVRRFVFTRLEGLLGPRRGLNDQLEERHHDTARSAQAMYEDAFFLKAMLNHKIKRRELFRLFAPSIMEEAVAEWFEEDDSFPFMMQVFPLREEKRKLIPGRHSRGWLWSPPNCLVL